eukprot:s4896_g1.t2
MKILFGAAFGSVFQCSLSPMLAHPPLNRCVHAQTRHTLPLRAWGNVQSCERCKDKRSASAFLVICGTLSLTGRPPKTRVCGRRKDYQKLRDAAADTADDAKSTEMDAPGEPGDNLMTADGWAARQQELVNIEFQEEKRQVEERLRNWPVEKLVAEGLALSNLQVKRDGEFFGDPLIEFSFPSAQPHDFQSGDWLLASKSSKHPLLPGALAAQVVDVQPSKIFCAMPVEPSSSTEWRLDRGVNYVTFNRIKEALSSFGGNGVPGDVRAILLGHDDLEEHNAMEDLSLQLPSEIALDDSQHEAVQSLQTQRLSLIQGPPGCGKTRTACSLLQAAHSAGLRVLAVADSNAAVDQLMQGLLSIGVEALRTGAPASVHHSLRERALKHQLQTHPRAKKRRKLMKELLELNRTVTELEQQAEENRDRLSEAHDGFRGETLLVNLHEVNRQTEVFDGQAWLEKKLATGGAVGWDMEWTPDTGREENPVALMQFADAHTALLLRTHRSGNWLPKSVRDLLLSQSCQKVTLGYDGSDRRKVQNSFGLEPEGVVDLQTMAEDRGFQRSIGLKKLGRAFGLKMYKDPTLSMSFWEASRLSEDQMRYAADDAFFTYSLYDRLLMFRGSSALGAETEDESFEGLEDPDDEASLLFKKLKKSQKNREMKKRELFDLENEMARDVLNEAQVICSTLSGCGSGILTDLTFDLVLMDETLDLVTGAPTCGPGKRRCRMRSWPFAS